ESGLPQYTTIQIPYTYAVLMAAHTYFTSVFMGRNPVFQYTGRHGESMQQVQAIEALHDYQMLVGQMLGPLYTWLYDTGKYGVGVLGLYWEDRVENVTSITQQPILDMFGQPTGKTQKIKERRQATVYSGNKIYNIQPWDFIFDTSYPIKEFQRGNYAGTYRKLSWNDIVRRVKQGYYMESCLPLLSSKGEPRGRDIGDEGSEQLLRPEHNDEMALYSSVSMSNKHPSQVGLYELCIELIPKDWDLDG